MGGKRGRCKSTGQRKHLPNPQFNSTDSHQIALRLEQQEIQKLKSFKLQHRYVWLIEIQSTFVSKMDSVGLCIKYCHCHFQL